MNQGGQQEKNSQEQFQEDKGEYENQYFKIDSKKKNIEEVLIY